MKSARPYIELNERKVLVWVGEEGVFYVYKKVFITRRPLVSQSKNIWRKLTILERMRTNGRVSPETGTHNLQLQEKYPRRHMLFYLVFSHLKMKTAHMFRWDKENSLPIAYVM